MAMPPTPPKLQLLLATLCGLYLLGYGVVRLTSLGTVESYGPGKVGPRQDFIAKRNHAPGEGWEYAFFWPAIKLEETAVNFWHGWRWHGWR